MSIENSSNLQEKINNYIFENPTFKGKTRDVVLSAMVNEGKITPAEYENAKKAQTFDFGLQQNSKGLELEHSENIPTEFDDLENTIIQLFLDNTPKELINPIITVAPNENLQKLAKAFNVSVQEILDTNPSIKDANKIKVGQQITLPITIMSDDKKIANRLSKEEAIHLANMQAMNKTYETIITSEIATMKISQHVSNFTDAAKFVLNKQGISTPSQEQLNECARELQLLNKSLKDIQLNEIKYVKDKINPNFAKVLNNAGFKPTAENFAFFVKFNALSKADQQKVIGCINYCKQVGIKDNDIKSQILKDFNINLFDSELYIRTHSNTEFISVQERESKISLEDFLTKQLQLDISQGFGKKLYDNISRISQDRLNAINLTDFKDVKNERDIINILAKKGIINLKSKNEQMSDNAKLEAIEVRKTSIAVLSQLYETVANNLEAYYNGIGLLDGRAFTEGMSNITGVVFGDAYDSTPELIKKYHQKAHYIRKIDCSNERTFKEMYKTLCGKDYDDKSAKEFFTKYCNGNYSPESEEFKMACRQQFGFIEDEYTNALIESKQPLSNIMDIANMLVGLECLQGLKLTQGLAKATYKSGQKLAKLIAPAKSGEKVAQTVSAMATGAETMSMWEGLKGSINNLSMNRTSTAEDWKNTLRATGSSALFGTFAGFFGQVAVNPLIKAVTKEQQQISAILTRSLDGAEGKTGAEFLETYINAAEAVTKRQINFTAENINEFLADNGSKLVGKGIEFAANTVGFTAYEASVQILSDLKSVKDGKITVLDETGNQVELDFGEYILKTYGEQIKSLAEFEGVKSLLAMMKLGRGANALNTLNTKDMLKDCKFLNSVKINEEKVDGKSVYTIETFDGNKIKCNSADEVLNHC